MAESEGFAAFIGVAVSLFAWGSLGVRILRVDRRIGFLRGLVVYLATLASIGGVVLVVLRTLAADDVRDDAGYVAMYLAIGYGATALNLVALRIFGLRTTDLTERPNPAAAMLLYAGSVASALAYAGANVGDGPGFHVVVFCAALAHAALYALVVLHAAVARTSYRILVDRDRGVAFRFGCLLVAAGLVLGRAVAGDWTSAAATFGDFLRIGWVAAALFVVDAVVGRVAVPREPEGGILTDGVGGLLHLAIAVAYVALLGVPA